MGTLLVGLYGPRASSAFFDSFFRLLLASPTPELASMAKLLLFRRILDYKPTIPVAPHCAAPLERAWELITLCLGSSSLDLIPILFNQILNPDLTNNLPSSKFDVLLLQCSTICRHSAETIVRTASSRRHESTPFQHFRGRRSF